MKVIYQHLPQVRTGTAIARPGTNTAIRAPQSTSSSSSAAASSAASAVAVSQLTAFQENVPNANMTIAQLCNGSYFKKYVGKRDRTAEAETTSKSKAKKANTATNAPNSSGTIRATAIGAGDPNASTGPRVEIINGKIVIKESSLVLNNVATAVEDDYEEVVESVHATATYSSFLKRRPSSSWGVEETRQFYAALRQTGLQFTMLQAFFPGRTRQQLKKKYLKEQQTHPELIELAINSAQPLDLTPFEAQLGDLAAPVDTVAPNNNIATIPISTLSTSIPPPAEASEELDSDIIEV